MTGIGHVATAFLFKARFREAPLVLLFIASEFNEMTWVVLNYSGEFMTHAREWMKVDLPWSRIVDMRLQNQPFSHSLMGVAIHGLVIGIGGGLYKRSFNVALALFLCSLGHWGLDFLVHDRDLSLLAYEGAARVGPGLNMDHSYPDLGLFSTAPWLGYLLQIAVSSMCLWYFFSKYSLTDPGDVWKFIVLVGVCHLIALLPFFPGALTWLIQNETWFIAAMMGEFITDMIVLYLAVKWYVPTALEPPVENEAS